MASGIFGGTANDDCHEPATTFYCEVIMKPKIEGIRKMSIAMAAITALTIKDTMEFKTAVIVCVIAITGIVCQSILDWSKNDRIQ